MIQIARIEFTSLTRGTNHQAEMAVQYYDCYFGSNSISTQPLPSFTLWLNSYYTDFLFLTRIKDRMFQITRMEFTS